MAVYTLFGQQATGSTLTTDATEYTFGMQFTLGAAAVLTGIWFYSISGATDLPDACCIFQVTGTGTGSIVPGSQDNTPSWSGAAGSGWVRCPYASGPELSADTAYKVSVQKNTTPTVYSFTSHYWDTGPGSGGLSSGVISAPANAGADGGQDSFTASVATLTYPASSFGATNYWLDVEVSTDLPGLVPPLVSQYSGLY